MSEEDDWLTLREASEVFDLEEHDIDVLITSFAMISAVNRRLVRRNSLILLQYLRSDFERALAYDAARRLEMK
jgi:hypothetical protein